MKREQITAIFPEATTEQVDKIMNANGADVEKAKKDVAALNAELESKKTAFDTLTAELNKLKGENASAADWQKKFEDLQNDVKEKEKAAQAAKEAAEKHQAIEDRFSAAVGEKKFSHDAIRKDYLAKFEAALAEKDNEGKSDADVLHALTKDDAGAFKGVNSFQLFGGSGNGEGDGANPSLPTFF